MAKSKKINVRGTEITIIEHHHTDFISLTDLVKGFVRTHFLKTNER